MSAKKPDIHEDTSRFAKTDKQGDKESTDDNYDIQKHFFSKQCPADGHMHDHLVERHRGMQGENGIAFLSCQVGSSTESW